MFALIVRILNLVQNARILIVYNVIFNTFFYIVNAFWYLIANSISICEKCNPLCTSCYGPSIKNCIKCNEGYEKDENYYCVKIQCRLNEYAHNSTWNLCHPKCSLYVGTSENDCIKCNNNFIQITFNDSVSWFVCSDVKIETNMNL